MYCSQCGKQIPDDSSFCPECGSKVSKIPVQDLKRKNAKPKYKNKKPLIVFFVVLLVAIAFQLNNNDEKNSAINQSTSDHDKSSDVLANNTVWSTDYLFEYADDFDKDIKKHIKFARNTLKKAEGMNMETYLKADDGLFGNGSYEMTSEQTEYGYSGKMKNNQPSGFGVLYRYCSMGIGPEVYIPVYMGDFKKGQYNGKGILFKDYSEDDEIASSIGYTFNVDESNLQEIIEQYLQSIEYIGEFKDGEKNGDGVSFEYPSLHFYEYEEADIDPNILDTKSITAYVGKYKNGKQNGKGKVYYHQKLLYEGDFKDGLMDGEGTSYYPNSEQKKYKGEWKNNLYNGKGTLYDSNGDVEYKGKWSNGDYTK